MTRSAPDRAAPSVVVDADICSGCRTCELACSFHHSGLMSPELSSIQVRRSNHTAAIVWIVTDSCDLCAGEEELQCAKHCGSQAIRLERPK